MDEKRLDEVVAMIVDIRRYLRNIWTVFAIYIALLVAIAGVAFGLGVSGIKY